MLMHGFLLSCGYPLCFPFSPSFPRKAAFFQREIYTKKVPRMFFSLFSFHLFSSNFLTRFSRPPERKKKRERTRETRETREREREKKKKKTERESWSDAKLSFLILLSVSRALRSPPQFGLSVRNLVGLFLVVHIVMATFVKSA